MTGENGQFLGVFVPNPAKPAAGENELDATLTDKGSTPVTGATLSVTPWMPAMGHGSSTQPEVTDKGDGKYHVDHIVYEMPGAWELRIEVTSGTLSDRFVLGYDVQ